MIFEEAGVDGVEGTRRINGQIVLDDIGAFGEDIADDLLRSNGWKDFKYIKNSSNHGIDIIAGGPNGHLGFFEVKTSSIGRIPGLSARQSGMDWFVNDVLSSAAAGTGRYRGIDSSTRKAAQSILDEITENPFNVSGSVIGVDLSTGAIRVSRWPR